MNRTRREVHLSIQSRLISLASKAINVVSDAVEKGDVKASLAVLKGSGLLSAGQDSIGSDDPTVLEEIDRANQAESEAKQRLLDLVQNVVPRI